jgi:hypothetical protein
MVVAAAVEGAALGADRGGWGQRRQEKRSVWAAAAAMAAKGDLDSAADRELGCSSAAAVHRSEEEEQSHVPAFFNCCYSRRSLKYKSINGNTSNLLISARNISRDGLPVLTSRSSPMTTCYISASISL